MTWEAVEQAVREAKSIAFDGCHKIYVLLDDEQTEVMTKCGYKQQHSREGGSRLYTSEEMTSGAMLSTIREWFANSCDLRFISSVRTSHEDPNAGFTSLIAQFEEAR